MKGCDLLRDRKFNLYLTFEQHKILCKSVLVFNLVDTLINYGEHTEICNELQDKLDKLRFGFSNED